MTRRATQILDLAHILPDRGLDFRAKLYYTEARGRQSPPPGGILESW
jgi:hypothetical protein